MTWKEKCVDFQHDIKIFFKYQLEDFLLRCFIVIVVGGLGVGAILATIDYLGAYRSQEAYLSCHLNQQDAYRFAFSDSVVCVPYATRQDITTVRVTQ